MTNIYKAQAVWDGFIGGPGVNTFYLAEEPTSQAPFKTFYEAIKTGIPGGVTVQVQNSGVSISAETGELTGAWNVDAETVTTGTGAGEHIAGAGVVVRWETGVIIAGRRLFGRTFLVPMAPDNFATNGQVHPAAIAVFGAAAVNLAIALDTSLGVWSRPRAGLAGSHHIVSSAVIPATAGTLTSRKR